MDNPFPFGLFYRLWLALNQNPCKIEIITDRPGDGRQWIRIRNDSNLPIQLFDIEFYWQTKKSRKFDICRTPLVWVFSDHTQNVLTPGNSFEHPSDVHEVANGIKKGKIVVHHNRSKHPTKKQFIPIYFPYTIETNI